MIPITICLLLFLNTIEAQQQPKIDLQVQSINLINPRAGERVTANVVVMNAGNLTLSSVGVRLEDPDNMMDTKVSGCAATASVRELVQRYKKVQTSVRPRQSVTITFAVVFKKAGPCQLRAVVPDSITLDANPANNTRTVRFNVAPPAPEICSFSTSTVSPGQRFEICGGGFKTSGGPNPRVTISGKPAQIDSVTATALWAQVPCQNLAGPAKVTIATANGMASKQIQIRNLLPAITSVKPQTTKSGRPISIYLTKLNTDCDYSVWAGGQKLPILSTAVGQQTTRLQVNLPRGIRAGRHKLSVRTPAGEVISFLTISSP